MSIDSARSPISTSVRPIPTTPARADRQDQDRDRRENVVDRAAHRLVARADIDRGVRRRQQPGDVRREIAFATGNQCAQIGVVVAGPPRVEHSRGLEEGLGVDIDQLVSRCAERMGRGIDRARDCRRTTPTTAHHARDVEVRGPRRAPPTWESDRQ